MRYIKYLALLAVLALPAVHSQAQVAVGVQIGANYGLYNPPPVCAYGYYPYYPYDCAPYGYWAPEWFVGGVFIGAGPWYHFYYTHPTYYRRFYHGPEFVHREGFDRFHGGYQVRGFRGEDRRFSGESRRFAGGEHFRDGGRGFRGGEHGFQRGGGGGFRGGEHFRGDSGGHGHGRHG